MTDSIIVFGRVCPSISSRQEVYQYGDRVVLYRKGGTIPRFDGPCRALIYAEPLAKNETSTVKRQSPLAYASGESYEDAIRALAVRLHRCG